MSVPERRAMVERPGENVSVRRIHPIEAALSIP